ncbi:hypothetical protein EQ875_00846 [Photobacterium damselae subsp. damselae]|nr:hypothetical protein EQ875_00846 [Photobacterium damselae subsp. damselae]
MRYFWLFLFFLSTVSSASPTKLTLDLVGVIPEVCTMKFQDNQTVELSSGKPRLINFEVNCNSPLSMSVQSDFGGIRHKEYHNEVVPYQLGIDMSGVNYLNITSQKIQNKFHIKFDGDINLKQQGSVNIALLRPMLWAGNYEDTLFIDVYPNSFK